MKDLLIGTLAGISAVVVTAWFNPRPTPVPAPIFTAANFYCAWPDDHDYLPTTQPSPAERKLEKIVQKIEVKGGRLDKLLAFLADTTGVNMSVNWRALEAAGIAADCPVTLKLHELPARIILKQTLDNAGGGNVKLAFRIADGVVRISTADELSREAVTRVYDVRDLIAECITEQSRYVDPRFSKVMTAQDSMDALVRVIQETIDPTTWRDAGGSIGGIRCLSGMLIVTLPPESHDQLRQLLTALRQKSRQP
jgi:hypothetical protein